MTPLFAASIVWFGSWLAPAGPPAPSNSTTLQDKEMFTVQIPRTPSFLSEFERNRQAERLLAASA